MGHIMINKGISNEAPDLCFDLAGQCRGRWAAIGNSNLQAVIPGMIVACCDHQPTLCSEVGDSASQHGGRKIGGRQTRVYALGVKDLGRHLRKSAREKAGIVPHGEEQRVSIGVRRPEGRCDGSNNPSQIFEGKIPGDQPAPAVRPEPELQRRRHQRVKRRRVKRLGIIALADSLASPRRRCRLRD